MSAGDKLNGTRVEQISEARGEDGYIPGCYWPGRTMWNGLREWWITDPTGNIGRLSTNHHTVVEHDDGTITVSPSILSTTADHGHDWHGYLERGIWREV